MLFMLTKMLVFMKASYITLLLTSNMRTSVGHANMILPYSFLSRVCYDVLNL